MSTLINFLIFSTAIAALVVGILQAETKVNRFLRSHEWRSYWRWGSKQAPVLAKAKS